MAKLAGSSKKNLIIILAALVLILGAALNYIQYRAMSNIREEVRQEEEAVDLARAHLTRLIRHRDNAAEYESRLAVAKKYIPETAGEEDLIRYLYALSDNLDLQVQEIRFGSSSVGEQYTTLPLSLNLEGNYQSLRQYLNLLYNGKRAIRVNEVRISRSGGVGTAIRANLAVAAFYNQED